MSDTAQTNSLASAGWTGRFEGVAELSKDWTDTAPPTLALTEASGTTPPAISAEQAEANVAAAASADGAADATAVPLAVERVAPSEWARGSGYCVEDGHWLFVFDPEIYRETASPCASAMPRIFVAGTFNRWQPGPEWEMKREPDAANAGAGGGSGKAAAAARLRIPAMPGGAEFKFVTADGHWLEIPERAPNRVRDLAGNYNYRLDPARTGRHVFRFRVATEDRQAPSRAARLAFGCESVPIADAPFLFSRESRLPMGVTWRRGGGNGGGGIGDNGDGGGVSGAVFRIFAPRATAVTLELWPPPPPHGQSPDAAADCVSPSLSHTHGTKVPAESGTEVPHSKGRWASAEVVGGGEFAARNTGEPPVPLSAAATPAAAAPAAAAALESIALVPLADGAWETTHERAAPGWRYQYRIHGENRDATTAFDPSEPVLDPYARAALGPAGPGILTAPTPPMPAPPPPSPPSSSASSANATVRPHVPPAPTDAVFLEAHLRDLLGGAPAGFRELAACLRDPASYPRRLGINVLELQPVTEYERGADPAEYHWGYMPVNWFCPASAYAAAPARASHAADLRDLVAACHEAGISLVLDVVYNHLGAPNALARADAAYHFATGSDGAPTNWSGCGNDLRPEAPMARRLVLDSLRHLVTEFDVDGFRFDLAELLGLPLLRDIERELRPLKPGLLLIAEPWSFRGHIGRALATTGYTAWNDAFRDFLPSYVHNAGGTDRLRHHLAGTPDTPASHPFHTLNYAQSHDDHCWIDRITENPAHDGSRPAPADASRTRLMHAILLAALGAPMLAVGQDFLHSKHGVSNTYQRGDLNALRYPEFPADAAAAAGDAAAAADAACQSGTGVSPVSPQPAPLPQPSASERVLECGTSVPLCAKASVSRSGASENAEDREGEGDAAASFSGVSNAHGTKVPAESGTEVPHSKTRSDSLGCGVCADTGNTGEPPVPLSDALVTHEHARAWIRFRLSAAGAALRTALRPRDGFFQFFDAPGTNALAALYNADSRAAAPRLLFAVNPAPTEVILPAPALDPARFLQIADADSLHENGLPPARRYPFHSGELRLPPHSSALWMELP